MASSTRISVGISAGISLAIVLSWAKNMSIGYAIVHGLCGWGYVIYTVITN